MVEFSYRKMSDIVRHKQHRQYKHILKNEVEYLADGVYSRAGGYVAYRVRYLHSEIVEKQSRAPSLKAYSNIASSAKSGLPYAPIFRFPGVYI